MGSGGEGGEGAGEAPDDPGPTDRAGPEQALFVGVDGGGTTTRALVTDDEGRELARVTGRPSLVDPRRPREAATVVAAVVRDALVRATGAGPRSSDGPVPTARALHAALAGAGRDVTRRAVGEALEAEHLAERVTVGTDVEAAFHDVFGAGPGMLLLAGTGSMAWGRSERGREARVGGWGALMGDEGSGWAIGLDGLRAVARAVDGRGPSTRLAEALADDLGLSGPTELIAWVGGASKGEVAGLVPSVKRAADRGDSVATAILERAVRELELHLTALDEALGPWTKEGGHPRVALAGGLLEPGGALRGALRKALAERGPELASGDPDPVRGAAALARRGR